MVLCASLSNLWQKGGVIPDMCALPVQSSDMQHFRGSKSMMYVMQEEMSYEMLKHCHPYLCEAK
jgi:hypothetical protein